MCPFDAEGGIQVVERARAQFGDAVGLQKLGSSMSARGFARPSGEFVTMVTLNR
jgi:hypothetical protein